MGVNQLFFASLRAMQGRQLYRFVALPSLYTGCQLMTLEKSKVPTSTFHLDETRMAPFYKSYWLPAVEAEIRRQHPGKSLEIMLTERQAKLEHQKQAKLDTLQKLANIFELRYIEEWNHPQYNHFRQFISPDDVSLVARKACLSPSSQVLQKNPLAAAWLSPYLDKDFAILRTTSVLTCEQLRSSHFTEMIEHFYFDRISRQFFGNRPTERDALRDFSARNLQGICPLCYRAAIQAHADPSLPPSTLKQLEPSYQYQTVGMFAHHLTWVHFSEFLSCAVTGTELPTFMTDVPHLLPRHSHQFSSLNIVQIFNSVGVASSFSYRPMDEFGRGARVVTISDQRGSTSIKMRYVYPEPLTQENNLDVLDVAREYPELFEYIRENFFKRGLPYSRY